MITFHGAAVEIIYAFHNNPYLSLRDVQWIRRDAQAVVEAANRQIAKLGGEPLRDVTQ